MVADFRRGLITFVNRGAFGAPLGVLKMHYLVVLLIVVLVLVGAAVAGYIFRKPLLAKIQTLESEVKPRLDELERKARLKI